MVSTPFFPPPKKKTFEGAHLQNYISNFNKIENIGFFILTLQVNQIFCNSENLGSKIEKILGDLRWNDPE